MGIVRQLYSERDVHALRALACSMALRKPVLFAGAGVSADAGYLTWPALLDYFDKELQALVKKQSPRIQQVSKKFKRPPEYPTLIGRMKDQLWRAEEYRQYLGGAFDRAIRKTFGPRTKKPAHLANVLASLDCKSVLTTNYDPTLEKAVAKRLRYKPKPQRVDWHNRDQVRGFFRDLYSGSLNRYFVYLHGEAYDCEHIVLTDSQYVDRYVLSDDANKKFLALFMTQPVLFVGFSLDDPHFEALFRTVQAHMGSGESLHFMFLPRPDPPKDTEPLAGRLRAKLGIEPIFYKPPRRKGVRHRNLILALRTLRSAVNELNPLTARKQLSAQTIQEDPDVQKILNRELPLPARRTLAKKTLRTDPDDINKGRFGGSPRRNGFELKASVTRTADPEWFDIKLEVLAPPKARPPRKAVFYLHQTFRFPSYQALFRNGRATFHCSAYGAFTVGVRIPQSRTRLELDLSELDGAPALFRAR